MSFKHLVLAAASVGVLTAVSAVPAMAQSREQIRIVGSSTVFPFAKAVVENFARSTGNPAPVLESTGSGGGLKLFCAGVGTQHPDIANSSRAIKKSELETCAQNGVKDVTEVRIGFDGIVLTSSSKGPDMDITRAQLWKALAKQVPVNGQLQPNPYKNWSEIDPSLPNQKIEAYGPPPTSGTRDAFVELVMDVGCEEVPEVAALDKDLKKKVCQTIREDGVYVDAGENDNLIVQKLDANPNAFGIFGYSFLEQNSDQVKAAKIGGVEPTFEAISSGEYPVSRSLYFYVKNAHVGVVPGLKEYVAEFTSEKAWGPDGYLADLGLIPLPDDQRKEARESALALKPVSF